MRAGALAIAVLAVLAAGGCRGSSSGDRLVRGDTGWTLRAPRGMHVERSGVDSMVTYREVTVASFPPGKGIRVHRTATTFGFDDVPPGGRGRFPAGGVALRIVREEGGPLGIPQSSDETRLPIRLSRFRTTRSAPPGRPRPREDVVTGDGISYQVDAWVGPKAPSRLRAELDRVVASLAFPRVREGQTVPAGRVLARATSYPVGSFTPFGRGYLVHAPGGFYAIQATRSFDGYVARCSRLVLARGQFLCTNLDARWDRLGRPLARPHGADRGEPLAFSPADVTWDGHVLLFDVQIGGVDPGTARRLYPHR